MSSAVARMQIATAVATLVGEVPTTVLKSHGSPHALQVKILDLICTDPIPEETPTSPKKRGRPKGSKNKPKTDSPTEDVPVEKRGRGRPKGSKNKPKTDSPIEEVPVEKRPRGRPKGSKNKPKTQTVQENPVEEKKRGRTAGTKDRHTRKSKKSQAAAIIIQQRWRTTQ
jgi:hypothetical protein